MTLNLIVFEKTYSICRFENGSVLPEWVYLSDFYSITKTKDEISVVTLQPDFIPEDIIINSDWRVIKIEGPLDFSLVGIIADLSAILKKKKISIFTVSTYDTDYVLVKQKDLDSGVAALREEGHNVILEEYTL